MESYMSEQIDIKIVLVKYMGKQIKKERELKDRHMKSIAIG